MGADERQYADLQIKRVLLHAAIRQDARAGGAATTELLDRLKRQQALISEAETRGAGEPARQLASRFDLTADEIDLLWLATAQSLSHEVAAHAEALLGSQGRRGATLSAFGTILAPDRERLHALARRLDDDHPLIQNQFLLRVEPSLPDVSIPYRICTRVMRFLAGEECVDAGVAACGGVIDVPEPLLCDAKQTEIVDRLADVIKRGGPHLVILEGTSGSGRRSAVAAAAATCGTQAVAIDAVMAGGARESLGALRRESALRGAIPVVANADAWTASDVQQLVKFVDSTDTIAVVTSTSPGLSLPTRRTVLRVRWPVPDTNTRRVLWQSTLQDPTIEPESLDEIAIRYRLGAGAIVSAARAAELINGHQPLTASDVIAGIRNNIAEGLGDLATHVQVKQSWNDLVLSSDCQDQVDALIARVRYAHKVYEQWGLSAKVARGQGVSALFTGPPGTGKTMVAGLIAKELDLEVYQVDLAKVVSKWVGETEKQLARIFDAADAGHALLLFDEADALFAKRTEVKGAVDRYANLEVNYLLQRVEAFGGLTILTTNLDSSIDPALKRRLAATVVFDPPDEDERELLWRKLLDARIDVDDRLDPEELAHKFPDMTGANIRNSVIAGAFLAAAQRGALRQEHLIRAARAEYRTTMGRVLSI